MTAHLETFRARRMWAGWGIDELALFAEVDRRLIRLLEAGGRVNASTIRRLDRALDLLVSIRWRELGEEQDRLAVASMRRAEQQQDDRQDRRARSTALLAIGAADDAAREHTGGRCIHNLERAWCATCQGTERKPLENPGQPWRGRRELGPVAEGFRPRLQDNYQPQRTVLEPTWGPTKASNRGAAAARENADGRAHEAAP